MQEQRACVRRRVLGDRNAKILISVACRCGGCSCCKPICIGSGSREESAAPSASLCAACATALSLDRMLCRRQRRWGWSNFEVTDVATGGTVSTSNSGFAGGGQIGCDYQWNAWVFGFRNMFDGTSLSSSRPFADTSTHWFDTLTARGGYLVASNVLLYVQGGAAWTNTKVTFLDVNGGQVGELTNDRTGWTVGGGVEWMFAPHWSVFAQYNFMGFVHGVTPL